MSEHKHRALIEEWVKDTSRVVECTVGGGVWVKVDGNPVWTERNEYRFAPVKPEVTSMLTDDTLTLIENDAFHRCSNTKSSWAAGRRAIANAAAQRQSEEDAKAREELQESLDDHKKYSVQLSKQISELENEYQKLSDEFNKLKLAPSTDSAAQDALTRQKVIAEIMELPINFDDGDFLN